MEFTIKQLDINNIDMIKDFFADGENGACLSLLQEK